MAYHSNGNYPIDDGDRDQGDSSVLGEDTDKSTYVVEHLATFTVTKETGIVYPADGMRRLLQLEKTNGIWSQKMQLCLDRSWVLIMDYETGSVMERFPASVIKEPTAFTSHDPMEIYNNILVFIVSGSGTGNGNMRSEMHIFQCQSVSATDLVEDFKDVIGGKMISRNRNPRVPSPPTKNFSQSPNLDHERRGGSNSGYYREPDFDLNDEVSSTTSERYERDVTVLNHCFDDIEKFIARLQHAAAASKELDRRRRSRKSKKRDVGDGILTLRTKPPPERDFIDIFQKFKLSFNLLAKLKAHIHDPNAPELVHFLFTPLALIVEASHETYYNPNLPSKVVSPLLTRQAVNLLINCVTSKETELWHSLGNAWLVPKDQWKENVASYHPEFMDGWSPDFPVNDEQEHTSPYSGKENRESIGDNNYSSDYFGYEQPGSELGRYMYNNRNNESPIHKNEPPSEHELHMGIPDISARSDISLDSIEHRMGGEERNEDQSQENWIDDLQARGANVVQVTYPRTANNDKELTVSRGEYLEILDDSRKWWKARNIYGKVGHVPHTIVTPHIFANNGSNNDPNEIFNNPLYARNTKRTPRQDSISGPGPSSNSREPPPPLMPADRVRKEHLDDIKLKAKSFESPPPPPPPPPISSETNTDTLRSNTSSKVAPTAANEMNDELKAFFLLRENRKPFDVLKTPEVYIRQTSTPSEVQKWLKAKSFSDTICDHFKGITGNEMFLFDRKTLDKHCGVAEGKRLYSQLLVQRNVSGFQTIRSSELQVMLAKARQKADGSQDED